MRAPWLLVLLTACGSPESRLDPTLEVTASNAGATERKPPDEMDERMRHCPLALDGAAATLEDIDGGVRFTVRVPPQALAELRRRASHIVEFAAKRSRKGHGEFDGKGGGRMKNCPVVTDDVAIGVAEIDGGARLDVMATPAIVVDQLRALTRERAAKFPFAGATITVAR
ncbi:MAG: hypothetical protein KF773_10250 [Deltaproteobacteria bacterium]|nr:hypothetical protein [Deltaproteobacteria bacterium]